MVFAPVAAVTVKFETNVLPDLAVLFFLYISTYRTATKVYIYCKKKHVYVSAVQSEHTGDKTVCSFCASVRL